MEKERVVPVSVLDKPVHGPKDILLRRLAHGVLLVIRQDYHIFSLIAKVLDKISGHIPDIVDAPAKLAALTEVVDANKQGFPSAGALRVLERVILGSSVAKVLGPLRRRWWGIVVPMDIRVRVHRGHSYHHQHVHSVGGEL